jgi:hypothetical protein
VSWLPKGRCDSPNINITKEINECGRNTHTLVANRYIWFIIEVCIIKNILKKQNKKYLTLKRNSTLFQKLLLKKVVSRGIRENLHHGYLREIEKIILEKAEKNITTGKENLLLIVQCIGGWLHIKVNQQLANIVRRRTLLGTVFIGQTLTTNIDGT